MSIKVLLVDDDPRKIGKVVAALVEAGIARDDVVVAQTASDARDRLSNMQYELLLLDLVLPFRAEDAASPKVGTELLRDVVEKGDLFKRPHHIVGLTQYEQIHEELAPTFSDQLWTLIHCDEYSDEWTRKVGRLAKYLLGVSSGTEGHVYRCDLCVITALAEPEFRAVLNLPWNWRETDPIDSCTIPVEGRIDLSGKSLSVIAATPNRAGMTASTVLASKLLQVFRPRVLALTGICAGVRGKTNIGDVVLGSPAWDWQRGKVESRNGKNRVLIEPIQIPVPNYVDVEFHRVAKDMTAIGEISKGWMAELPQTPLKLRLGPIATGGLVIATAGGMEVIRGQHRNLMAVDMETFGVYGAATLGPDPRPTYLSVKGVSDFGDDEKDDRWQPYAAYASARALAALVRSSDGALFRMAGRI
jgi:nucleoside phosphorylase/CheY-like chemotaxis protein